MWRSNIIATRTKRQIYKVVLIGEARAGKTSIRRRYLGKGFSQNYMVTLGADFAIKRIKNSAIQIWDLAGQAVYKHVRDGYYQGAQGAILVFDITNPSSFDRLPNWYDEITDKIRTNIPMVLVGNKADLRDEYENTVSNKRATNYAKLLSNQSGFNVPYLETSALTGMNIENVFDDLVEEINLFISVQRDR